MYFHVTFGTEQSIHKYTHVHLIEPYLQTYSLAHTYTYVCLYLVIDTDIRITKKAKKKSENVLLDPAVDISSLYMMMMSYRYILDCDKFTWNAILWSSIALLIIDRFRSNFPELCPILSPMLMSFTSGMKWGGFSRVHGNISLSTLFAQKPERDVFWGLGFV